MLHHGPSFRRRAAGTLIGVALLLLVSVPLHAQYFGQNNVHYKTFDFKILKTTHFDIYYYDEEREASEQAARMAERWYERYSHLLGYSLPDRQPVILYASHPHFEQTNTLGSAPGEGTGGVTEAFKRRVVLPFAGPIAETDHVLGHELVHAFQYSITGQGHPLSSGENAAERLPLWFIEGMAEYLSLGPIDPHTAMWMREAARQDKLPTIHQLINPRFFPYRYGQALWAYIGGRWGDETIGKILRAAGRTGDAEGALERVLGIKVEDLSKDWHAAIRDAYRNVATGRQPPSAYGKPIETRKGGGELNVAPAISPNGDRLVFLSELELFSIEIFLADARTGEVERKLSKTAVDPHFDSLQFINSAGAWDHSGQRIALGAVSAGQPVLAILDAKTGRRLREIAFPQLGEIFTPTWSPDGRSVAFSAIVGGLTDLYICDLQTGKLRRLTEDAYADLQPAWSPDGKSIAFVTDRFSSDLQHLKMGNYRLATIDVESGDIQSLPSFPDAKNINPQWASQGSNLYFLSDRGGITNLYRVDTTPGNQIMQVTDLISGVSGITSISPALSAAAGSPRVVFSAYEGGDYDIYSIDAPDVLTGHPPTEPTHYAGLLPGGKVQGQVATLDANPTRGLPDAKDFASAAYHPSLSLDWVGQPYLAVGSDRFGTFVGGGTSLFFSDMLGDHQLGTMLQVNGSFRDIAALVSYENRKSRLDWGAVVEQIPYRIGTFSQAVGDVNGQPSLVEQTIFTRQTERRIAGVAAYPVTRAFRIEASAGYRGISFSEEQQTVVSSLITGQVLVDQTQDVSSTTPSLHLGELSGAMVYDTALFGATSPILGRRFRLEASPTIGSINYTGILADYRQYFMPFRPYTLAFRVLHYGRYGTGGQDQRLVPLYVGYPNLVRGYDVDSFSANECVGGPPGSCPVFDQLLGSRMLVGNVELRVPLFGIFGPRRNLYGPIPVELAAFYDAGVAWNEGQKPKLFGGDRSLVRSVGGAARINVFGYVIAEVDYVHPLDRPQKGWTWTFNFTPGF
jgi:WD40 repeat protein